MKKTATETRSNLLLAASQWAVILLSFSSFWLQPTFVQADAITMNRAASATTIAEVFVGNDQVSVEIEIGPSDIEAFKNLMNDELLQRFEFSTPLTSDQRLTRFFNQEWVISADGKRLPGSLVSQIGRAHV